MTKPLPLFPNLLDPQIEATFSPLCENLPESELKKLFEQVASHLEQIRAALRLNEFINLDVAEEIAQRLAIILDTSRSFPAEKRRLIVGAARYFVREKDAAPDSTSILGLDDDLIVLNFVLTELGRPDLKVID